MTSGGPAKGESDPLTTLTPLTTEDVAEYLVTVGTTLSAYGCPAYRLEDVMRLIAETEGHVAEPFALPTALFVNVSTPDGRERVARMSRVEEHGTDLGRLVAVDEIFNDVAARKISIPTAQDKLAHLEKLAPKYPAALEWISTAAVAGSAAVFFRGNERDVVVSAITAVTIAAVGKAVGRMPSGRFLVDFFGGVVAALAAWTGSHFVKGVAPDVVVIAGVISLIPGMKLTTGIAEVARKHLVSGAARLMDTAVTFLSLLFGIALVVGLGKFAGLEGPEHVAREDLGLAAQVAALVAASLGFGILFHIPKKYLWAALLSGALGYATTALGTRHLPGHVAAFGASLAVCTLANGMARTTGRPAQLFQLPGMMLLVPGSFGFLSLDDFLRGEIVQGAAKGFQMTLIAGALVMGVLVSNVLLPSRKLL